MENTHIAIVGAGPRGIGCLERLCSSAKDILKNEGKVTIHVIDPYPPGPGKVWRTNQPPRLLMNTVASQITLFTDESVNCKGPKRPGPTLHEWAAGESWLQLGPNDYATRFAYGCYLDWAYHEICKRATKENAIKEIVEHRASAIRLQEPTRGGRQRLTLSTNATLPKLSAVILAQGHVSRLPSKTQTLFFDDVAEHNNLRYFPPGNPADTNLGAIAPNESVLLRGLGLVFFDYMILLSSRRGGRFEPSAKGLTYHPSGKEPKIYACSTRGIPHHARGDNEKGAYGRHTPVFLTKQKIDEFNQKAIAGGDNAPRFKKDIWPLIAKEIKSIYYKALFKKKKFDEESAKFINRLSENDSSEADSSEADDLKRLGVAQPAWSWERLRKPQGKTTFSTAKEWNDWLLKYLKQDIEEAKQGNIRGPLKAALDALRDIRNQVSLIVDHHGVNGASYRDDIVKDFSPLNAFLSIGPPRRRVEEMVALIEAGVLQVLGPEPTLTLVRDAWLAKSIIPCQSVEVKNIIEAYIPPPNLTHTEDPLLRYMLDNGQCRPHTIDGFETGAIDITRSPYQIIDKEGSAHTRRFAIGVPTEGVHWVTTAGARPCVNSVNLVDNDAVAQAALHKAYADLISESERGTRE
ncbi:hypothetical protein M406DRAFT_53403 [Cryphonectria parasitica EP155]|uniref:FAD-dependent urate hydroxylase HpyO/Asp monooxygenase CreE-like FAD/NAD(P)-binding domain-containing protein n=1 Tax=Cryphonectria parasitica (strain ATCC 38755 / EP155) TaxID=660469 RepID=A0A9P5CKJ0_CRYP1|nr:uncharacterized protein M406DRAFT_53403 [Cryphonectria parasitica EP155]KAF3762123.1 hypothetical protein M406DRAFT_53403 [Cryphonectria parasitica EP155]